MSNKIVSTKLTYITEKSKSPSTCFTAGNTLDPYPEALPALPVGDPVHAPASHTICCSHLTTRAATYPYPVKNSRGRPAMRDSLDLEKQVWLLDLQFYIAIEHLVPG